MDASREDPEHQCRRRLVSPGIVISIDRRVSVLFERFPEAGWLDAVILRATGPAQVGIGFRPSLSAAFLQAVRSEAKPADLWTPRSEPRASTMSSQLGEARRESTRRAAASLSRGECNAQTPTAATPDDPGAAADAFPLPTWRVLPTHHENPRPRWTGRRTDLGFGETDGGVGFKPRNGGCSRSSRCD